jgi:hypothetical protein
VLVVFLAAYSYFGYALAKCSEDEDTEGGMRNYDKSFALACTFLVIFGFTFPIFAFGTIMSFRGTLVLYHVWLVQFRSNARSWV